VDQEDDLMALFKREVRVTKSLAMNGKETGAIVGVKGALLGRIIRMDGEVEYVVGRDSSESEVVIDSDNVEAKHCSIKYVQVDKNYVVCNLSDGDVIADGEEIAKGESKILQPGTRIVIGTPSNEIRLG